MKCLCKYVYDGPVMEFDKCIQFRWRGETMAASEKQAKNNLKYQYKKMHNKSVRSKINLPGKLTFGD